MILPSHHRLDVVIQRFLGLLAQGGWIASSLADGLKRMVGFRKIAVHGDQTLQLPITVSIIEKHLDEFLHYSQAMLQRDAAQTGA